MSFKVGAEDAEYLEKEYAPLLSQQDISGIANFTTYVKLNIIPIKTKKFQKLLKNILEKHMAAKKNMLIWSLKLEWELFANKKYYVSSNSFIFGNFINTRRRMYSAMSL